MPGGKYGLPEKPLPKPGRDLAGYAAARVLEALLEALLALRLLREGLTRNAAGKVFQAWRALTAALLVLERDRILESLRDEREKRWLKERGIPRVPTSRLKPLSRLLEEAGYKSFSATPIRHSIFTTTSTAAPTPTWP